ncbi:hypothetical protein [Actinoalloteichus spitiensis]|uniref:hypothetical protein n=1 Tax=Actinoalloteichus spitiensis TaxID=252394 RepID=UPI000370344B|nr:hypothetical protein [Actinoalloteichus spitiensis]
MSENSTTRPHRARPDHGPGLPFVLESRDVLRGYPVRCRVAPDAARRVVFVSVSAWPESGDRQVELALDHGQARFAAGRLRSRTDGCAVAAHHGVVAAALSISTNRWRHAPVTVLDVVVTGNPMTVVLADSRVDELAEALRLAADHLLPHRPRRVEPTSLAATG